MQQQASPSVYGLPSRRIIRWEGDFEPGDTDMEFRLTYAGQLLAHRDDKRLEQRSLHVHSIRKEFHRQLKVLWSKHPVLIGIAARAARSEGVMGWQIFRHDDFNWLPMVTEHNGTICKVDVLMLRGGPPGQALSDIDNRLKTIFDALRKAKGPSELGGSTSAGQRRPDSDEDPFHVLLEDDSLITHVAVTTDTLLEPVPNVPEADAARLVLTVTVQPYRPMTGNIDFM